MVKTLSCTRGHRWQIDDEVITGLELRVFSCPMCGAQAETVSDGTNVHETSSDAQARPGSHDPNRLTGYEILDEAGRGGMGVVYRALDRQHNRIVALKTLQRIDAVALQRFKKEFRSLADVSHRNLVSLYELISDGDNWCFTMELVEGVDLLQYVRHGPLGRSALDAAVGDATVALDPAALRAEGQPGLSAAQLDRLRSVVGQLASGIAALHAAGILHRDIKPSNILVTSQGRAVLLDFGLAAALDEGDSHRNSQDGLLGTVAYMSPEQAASETVSHATDWYAVGSLLYEALTGQTPFTGKPLRVLQKKQKKDPLPPSASWPDVPSDLDQLCVRLLHRDPTERATESEVLRVLGRDHLVTKSPRVALDESDHLIGRDQHLATLREAYSNVKQGRAANLFAHGASGNGKTALVQNFLDEIRQLDDVVVLSGRCYERESVPFKAIDSLIDSLVAYLKRLSPAEAGALMPRDVQSLVRLFPVIGQIEAAASLPRRKTELADQQELNRRAIGALRELLARMGDRCRLVVYIDDLQWGDEDSAAMVSDLLQRPDSPVLLFLGTYRSEDAETSPFLHAFRQIQLQRELPLEMIQVEVKPLGQADATRLALALLDRADAEARRGAEAIAREAAGNPFFVSELVKQLQLDGGLISSSATEPLALADMIWSRVQRLSDESQRLLEVVTLAGQPLPLEQALRIADAGQSAVTPLRAGHLIRSVGASLSSTIETYHDRVRESVGARLDQEKARHQHRRIAEDYARQSALQASELMERLEEASVDGAATIDELNVDAAWYDVAFHFDAAGRSDLAFPYALATAEKARTQFSLEVSEDQYRIAERGVAGHDNKLKYRVAEGLGDIMMLRGKYDDAKQRFDKALELAPDSEAEMKAKLGELAFKQGDMERAIEAFETALNLLGQAVPQQGLSLYVRLAREGLVQVQHSMLPAHFLGRTEPRDVEMTLLVIRLHNRLTYAYWFKRGQYLCLWSHLRGMNLAERYPPTLELAHAYSIHAPVMGLLAFFERGINFAQKSLAIYTSLEDLWGQGQALNFHGVVLYSASRYEECIERCRAAGEMLERAGDLWEVNVARVHTAFSLFRLGELAACAELAKRIHFAGVELGDAQAAGFSLDVWAQSTGGQLPHEVLQTELQRPREDVQVRCQVMVAEGVRLFWLGLAEQATDVFGQGQQLADKAGIKNAYVLPLRPWLASALRRQAEMTSDSELRLRIGVLKRAARVASRAVKAGRKYRNELPHALRESGVIAVLQGKSHQARKLLDESLAVAEDQAARFEHAQTLLARGKIGRQHDWPEAERDLATAQQALRAMGADFVLAAE